MIILRDTVLRGEENETEGSSGGEAPKDPEGVEIDIGDADDGDEGGDEPEQVTAEPEGDKPSRRARRAERGQLHKKTRDLEALVQQQQQQMAQMQQYLQQQHQQQLRAVQQHQQPQQPQVDDIEQAMERIRQQKQDLVEAWNARAPHSTTADHTRVLERSRRLDDEYMALFMRKHQGPQQQQQQYTQQELVLLARHPDIADPRVNQVATAELALLQARSNGQVTWDMIDASVEKARNQVYGRQTNTRQADPSMRRKLQGMPAQGGAGGSRDDAAPSRKVTLSGQERAIADAWANGKNFKDEKAKYLAYYQKVLVPRNAKAAKRAEERARKNA